MIAKNFSDFSSWILHFSFVIIFHLSFIFFIDRSLQLASNSLFALLNHKFQVAIFADLSHNLLKIIIYLTTNIYLHSALFFWFLCFLFFNFSFLLNPITPFLVHLFSFCNVSLNSSFSKGLLKSLNSENVIKPSTLLKDSLDENTILSSSLFSSAPWRHSAVIS